MLSFPINIESSLFLSMNIFICLQARPHPLSINTGYNIYIISACKQFTKSMWHKEQLNKQLLYGSWAPKMIKVGWHDHMHLILAHLLSFSKLRKFVNFKNFKHNFAHAWNMRSILHCHGNSGRSKKLSLLRVLCLRRVNDFGNQNSCAICLVTERIKLIDNWISVFTVSSLIFVNYTWHLRRVRKITKISIKKLNFQMFYRSVLPNFLI